MSKIIRPLAVVAMAVTSVTSLHAQGLPQRIAELEARIAALEATGTAPQDITIDCSAGQSISGALDQGAGRSGPLTIRVLGVCTEQVTVRRDDVTILGMSIDAGLTSGPSTLPVLSALGAQRLQIRGLALTGGPTALRAAAGASVVARNMRISGAGTGVEVSESTLELNTATVEGNDSGVSVTHGGSLLVINSIIRDSAFSGASATASSLVIRGSTVETSDRDGVFGWHRSAVQVEGSTIRDNDGTGIGLQSGSTLRISGNSVVSGNARSGIGAFFNSHISMQGATVENNLQSGLNVHSGSSVVFSQGTNIVRANQGGIRLSDTSVAGSFGGTIEITANTGTGIRCDPAPAVAQITGAPGGFSINLTHVFGNAGPVQISCPGF